MAGSRQPKDRGMMKIYPRARWARLLMKTPLISWRLGLGPITGRLFIALTTTGRKSGLPRRTMIEYHTTKGKKYAPCAFGIRSQWYQNILADPRVTIQTSDGTESALAIRVTDDDELLDVYDLFMRRDAPLTKWYLKTLDIEPGSADLLAKKDRVHFIRFDPTNEAAPPGLAVDLVWLWPVGLFALFALLWILIR